MPYEVESTCPACNQGDKFTIGYWPKYLGVYVCTTCRRIANIELESGQCTCGHHPEPGQFYDYAYSIPFYNGELAGPLEPGPVCPKCGQGHVTFKIASHFNCGRLGQCELATPPWRGHDYLEKAIFVYALAGIANDLGLDLGELAAYYNIDPPFSLLADRHISLPILMDIHNHLLAAVISGEARFSNMTKLLERAEAQFGDLGLNNSPADAALPTDIPRRPR